MRKRKKETRSDEMTSCASKTLKNYSRGFCHELYSWHCASIAH
jgi:hypothetical protein